MSGVMPVNPLVTLVNPSFRCGQLTGTWLTNSEEWLIKLTKPNNFLVLGRKCVKAAPFARCGFLKWLSAILSV
jgi:hypothetical protein